MKPLSREKLPIRSCRRDRRKNEAQQGARGKYAYYLALARTEAGNGDRIAAENYYQHAEHYFRAAANAAETTQNRP